MKLSCIKTLLIYKGMPFWIFDQLRGVIERQQKLDFFALRKKGKMKHMIVKIVKCYHQATWKQKK